MAGTARGPIAFAQYAALRAVALAVRAGDEATAFWASRAAAGRVRQA